MRRPRPERALALLVAVPFALGAAAAPPDERDVVVEIADPAITEASGLVVVDGDFGVVNDSGDGGRVFVVDPVSGRTVGTTSWAEAPRDTEALAPAGAGHVWVGDIGDNRRVRESVTLLRVPVGRGDRTVEPEAYELVYPDGARDAETLVAHPGTGQLLVVSKEVLGGSVYAVPRRLDADRPNRLRRLAPGPAFATDGAFWPDGRHLLVRGYSGATLLSWPTLERVASVALPSQRQGEAIAVGEDDEVLVLSEGLHEPVLRVELSPEVRAALDPAPATASVAPEPGTDTEVSREDPAPSDPADAEDRPAWPWFLGGWVGLGVLVLLLRWLWGRPRR
ncbi:WD40 repeat domain-containing protein [Nocardioides ochotonae]|uniref:WD40 repeat domain-containing protein n=1 Tax=Nocardioides ochotonae TaxID=2685869 RepID=UPI00140E74AE|nr:WD40 repeat domain-containing protein [Nocardioides ochotonae]